MNKSIEFFTKERENLFLDGLVDNPMMYYYELKGDSKEVMKRCIRGSNNISNPYYTAGEILSVPATIPFMIASFSKMVVNFYKKKEITYSKNN